MRLEEQGDAAFVGVVVHGMHESQIGGIYQDTGLFGRFPEQAGGNSLSILQVSRRHAVQCIRETGADATSKQDLPMAAKDGPGSDSPQHHSAPNLFVRHFTPDMADKRSF